MNNSCVSSSTEESDSTDKSYMIFDITLSVDEWKTIQSREKIYFEKHGPRMYKILSPYQWTNYIHEHFFLHSRLPCCLTFKKAKVSCSGMVFLSIRGRYTTCDSIFDGKINDIPEMDTKLIN
jgi:hypothetical protein